MAEQPKIYILEFVDKRNTTSLIAEAIANDYISKSLSLSPGKIIAISSGIDVQKIREARHDIDALEEIAEEYKVLARSGYEMINTKGFMRNIGGDLERIMIRKILKKAGLSNQISEERLNNPRQTTRDLLSFLPQGGIPQKDSNDPRYFIGQIISMGNEKVGAKTKEIYSKRRMENLVTSINTQEIALTPQANYEEVLANLRAPVEKVVDEYVVRKS